MYILEETRGVYVSMGLEALIIYSKVSMSYAMYDLDNLL